MQLISRYIQRMPKTTTCDEFLRGVTAYIRKHYKKSHLPRLAEHPEDRMTASAVIYSRLSRQLWLVGDCHCLVTSLPATTGNKTPEEPHTQYYENPKPYEAQLAALRAEEARRQMDQGITQDELLRNDTARPVIIPQMIETMRHQNITYSVIDGFPIPRQHVPIITLDFQPWELVLASDGYPFLCTTLAESEQRLLHQRETDPLNIGPDFQATKAFHPDYNSFDDRAYIRFRV